MVRYWFAFTPVAILGTIVILSLPWLGLIAVLVAACLVLATLASLVWATAALAVSFVRAAGHDLHGRRRTRVRTASGRRAAAPPYAYAAARSAGYQAPQLWSSADISASGRDSSEGEPMFREGRVS